MNDKNEEKKDAIQRTPESEAFNLAQRQAQAWASSSIIPTAYRGNVSNVLIAMEIAKRIGASALAVMQNLYIVHGNPAFSASFLIATVNGSGRFTPIRYRMEGTKGKDDWGCRAYATDKESGEECLGPAITVKMAIGEGWWSKKDKHGKECSKWQTMPELMLHYRAAAFWTRVYCPELSMGMHTTEEMEDVEAVQAPPAEVVSPVDVPTEKPNEEPTPPQSVAERMAQEAAEKTNVKPETKEPEPTAPKTEVVTKPAAREPDPGETQTGSEAAPKMVELILGRLRKTYKMSDEQIKMALGGPIDGAPLEELQRVIDECEKHFLNQKKVGDSKDEQLALTPPDGGAAPGGEADNKPDKDKGKENYDF